MRGGHEAHVPENLHVFCRQPLVVTDKFVNIPLENSEVAFTNAL